MQTTLTITGLNVNERGSHLRSWIVTLKGLVRRVFGCWRHRMGWPITRNGKTFRSCVKCGTCRRFDPETWKSFGPFYYNDRIDVV